MNSQPAGSASVPAAVKLYKIELLFLPGGVLHIQARMNNREHSKKSNKNQFSVFVENRKALSKAKDPKVKKEISPEKLAEKEVGYQLFLAKKAMRKALRRKNHLGTQ